MKKNIEVLFKNFLCALCASMKACVHISLKENVYLRSRFNELCCREVVHDSNVDVFLGTGDDVDNRIPVPLSAGRAERWRGTLQASTKHSRHCTLSDKN